MDILTVAKSALLEFFSLRRFMDHRFEKVVVPSFTFEDCTIILYSVLNHRWDRETGGDIHSQETERADPTAAP